MTIKNKINSVDFFRAGNAMFTVSNKDTHYTFRIRKEEFLASNGQKKFSYKVYHFTGTENNNFKHFTRIGKMNRYSFEVANFKNRPMTQELNIVQWAIDVTKGIKKLPKGYAIQNEDRCCRCFRELSNPASIDTNYGKECAKHIGIEWKKQAS
jgi:hypothetical protein